MSDLPPCCPTAAPDAAACCKVDEDCLKVSGNASGDARGGPGASGDRAQVGTGGLAAKQEFTAALLAPCGRPVAS